MLQVSSSVLLLEATKRINTQGLFGHVLGVKMTNTLPQLQGIKRSAFPFVRNFFFKSIAYKFYISRLRKLAIRRIYVN